MSAIVDQHVSMTPDELLAPLDDRMRAIAEALRVVVRATLPDAIDVCDLAGGSSATTCRTAGGGGQLDLLDGARWAVPVAEFRLGGQLPSVHG
jgi:hypothetical protein